MQGVSLVSFLWRGSHSVARVDLELNVWCRLFWSSGPSSCFCLLGAAITDISHHAQLKSFHSSADRESFPSSLIHTPLSTPVGRANLQQRLHCLKQTLPLVNLTSKFQHLETKFNFFPFFFSHEHLDRTLFHRPNTLKLGGSVSLLPKSEQYRKERNLVQNYPGDRCGGIPL